MIKYDDSSLNVEERGKLPMYAKLEEFAMQVFLVKPMINFVVTNECISNKMIGVTEDNKTNYQRVIDMLLVYERGEMLGSISCDMRYRGGDKDLVYEVTSHRINKSRGHRETTASKDIKVAIRTAKKLLMARAHDEAAILIAEKVLEGIRNIFSASWNAVRWDMDSSEEAFNYAMLAHKARKNNDAYVKLPTKPATVKGVEEHHKHCAVAEDILHIKNMHKDNKGYGVQELSDGSFYVLNYAENDIKRYANFYALPEAVQSKYGVFKVLKEQEVVTTIGVKFKDYFAYVVE